MKLEKKHWMMLIAGLVIVFLVYWFFFRKKKSESSYNENVPIWGIGMGLPSESGYIASKPILNRTADSGYAGIYGSFGNESGYERLTASRLTPSRTQSNYAGVYGSFGNESGYDKQIVSKCG